MALAASVRIFAVLLVVMLVAGCAGRETEALMSRPGDLPQTAELSDVPFFPQQEKACGPASLAMVLNWSGMNADPDRLASLVYTPGREGSLATDMLGAARRKGRLAVPIHGLRNILAEISAGHPVVVFQNLGLWFEPLWHFAVAVGYDLPQREIVLHSGIEPRMRMSMDTFEHTWDRSERWAVVVLPPDRLPATAGELEVVEAAAGLERTGHAAAARTAYETMLTRWPESLPALMGLGNARYALDDLDGASDAFRRAVELYPQAAAGWNNLAHVLMRRGKLYDAREAVQKAVELGGEAGPFGETQAEIKAEITAVESAFTGY